MLDRFRLTYRLDIEDGQVRVHSGRPPQSFVSAVTDVVRLHRISRGRIECVGQGAGARLRFTHGFPQAGRQAVRNVWTPPTTPASGGNRRARG